jgi:hypothetical protein
MYAIDPTQVTRNKMVKKRFPQGGGGGGYPVFSGQFSVISQSPLQDHFYCAPMEGNYLQKAEGKVAVLL